jgi:hypothetical protein
METLRDLLDNPAGLVLVLCLAGVVVVANLALLALLRGGTFDLARFRRSLNDEAGLWRRSVTGGRDAQKRQDDQLDELHQLVTHLKEPPDNPTSPPP